MDVFLIRDALDTVHKPASYDDFMKLGPLLRSLLAQPGESGG
jgi:hypothetical protein